MAQAAPDNASTATLEKRRRYQQLKSALWTERQTFDAHYRDLADFVRPRRTRFTTTDKNRGDKRNQSIIDSTATFALRTLASGMHAGLTSPARPWMRLTTPDPELAQDKAVKQWLHTVTQRMLTLFIETNIYNVLPQVYSDMGLFGTAAMSMLDDDEDIFRCYAYPIGSYAFDVDARGLPTAFCREFNMSVGSVVEEFGLVQASERVKNLYRRGQYTADVPVSWVVAPNAWRDETKLDAKYTMKFASVHYEESGLGFLRESGFDTFPVMCPRWDVTSSEDTYGTDCPGMTALGDVRQLQSQHRKFGVAVEKGNTPPMAGSSALKNQVVNLLPGGITFDDSGNINALRPLYQPTTNLEHLMHSMEQAQYRIKRAFYEDLFLLLAQSDGNQQMTAREVDERHEEKLLALGPVLERTDDELLDQVVSRGYAIMNRRRLIPPPPPVLHNVKLRVEFISIMNAAQRLVGVVGLDRLMQSVSSIAPIFPDALDRIDIDVVADEYADMLGVNPKVLRSIEDAQALRQQRAQQQQSAMEAEQAKNLAAAAAQAGAKPIAANSPLDRVLSGVQQVQ